MTPASIARTPGRARRPGRLAAVLVARVTRVALVALVALAGIAGCDGGASTSGGTSGGVTTRPTDRLGDVSDGAAPATDPVLTALLAARSLHRDADARLDAGDPAGAAQAVERILALPGPASAPEWDATLLDARARLALLHVDAGRLDAAEAVCRAGLAPAGPPSFFRANLHAVLGTTLEARARAAGRSDAGGGGDDELARALRREAILAHEASLKMNQAIQRRLAEEATP